jgi:hypothetical protein
VDHGGALSRRPEREDDGLRAALTYLRRSQQALD